MSEELTKAQQIFMWELFAAGGEKLNKDILPRPEKKDRETLHRKGLLETRKADRSISIELTDKGWRWIVDTEPFPIATDEKRVTAERRLLQSLMRSIKRYAAEHDKRLQDLFRESKKSDGRNNLSITDSTEKVSFENDSSIETHIADAFTSIAGNPPMRQVRLRALRERLSYIPKAKLDVALISMRDSGRAKFSTLSNPPDIEAEGDAALIVRDQQFHTIWIES